MRGTDIRPHGALRPDDLPLPAAGDPDHALRVQPPLPGDGGRPLRHGDARRDVELQPPHGSLETAGALSGGRQRPPGPGRADGHDVGPSGGRENPGRPRFNLTVPPDGYAWWYIDALSDDGRHGITVIAFIGSVFSPWYWWARRRGPANPENHVGLNVALYGAPARWCLTERGHRSLARSEDTLAIGPSHLEWAEDSLTIHIDERCAPIPTRLRGTIRVTPEIRTNATFTVDTAGRHRWSPLAPRARVEVALTSPALSWSGTGYFDHNEGSAPLERDFISWDWSCARLSSGAGILYDTQCRDGSTRSLALHIAPDGAITQHQPPPRIPLARTGIFQVKRTTQSHGQARATRTLLDAPFYARSVIQTELFGEQAEAVHESVSLNRFRSPIVQGMLPFRIPRNAK